VQCGRVTPLHAAVQVLSSGIPSKLVDLLLASGGSANARDATGRTPAMVALAVGSVHSAVACLAAGGADLDARDAEGRTALVYAIMCPSSRSAASAALAAEQRLGAAASCMPGLSAYAADHHYRPSDDTSRSSVLLHYYGEVSRSVVA